MPNPKWSKKDIPSQNGKVVLVTGGTGGLGYETALGLAEVGATVILAGRSEERGKEALEKIRSLVPNAKISFEKLDLGSLVSIAEFCKRFLCMYEKLDTLINNAGVIGKAEKRQVTVDGFELQFGTNYLGHFALTAQLLPALRRAPEPRVVNIRSSAHRVAKVHFDDLQMEKYDNLEAYGQSKLCNILFTMELQRKSDAEGWGLTCISAHPGFSKTDMAAGLDDAGWSFKLGKAILLPVFGSTPPEGALPSLYAATSPDAKACGYYGPNGVGEMSMSSCCGGAPSPATMNPEAKKLDVAKKLWDVSCNLSNVTWN